MRTLIQFIAAIVGFSMGGFFGAIVGFIVGELVCRLMERFGVKNTAGLVFYAVKNELVE